LLRRCLAFIGPHFGRSYPRIGRTANLKLKQMTL
jgi:hypothetical protein